MSLLHPLPPFNSIRGTKAHLSQSIKRLARQRLWRSISTGIVSFGFLILFNKTSSRQGRCQLQNKLFDTPLILKECGGRL
jgi:hypothetical protein